MCLVALSIDHHPDYSLIVATNRDEFYARKARPASFWMEDGKTDILAGKDLEAGGTWMGATPSARWALVTNYRDPSIQKENPPSRGELVPAYLSSDTDPKEFLMTLKRSSDRYNGFNLLAGIKDKVYYLSNIEQNIQQLPKGVHTLSNATLNVEWPKTSKIKTAFESVLRSKTIDTEQLFEILTDSTQADEEILPKTGIPLDWEKAISPIFISTPKYGTRCSTILLIHRNGTINFMERTYDHGDPNSYIDSSFNLKK